MKILLIQPPLNPNIIGAGIGYLTEPLALEIIAASIPHHTVEILDMRIEPDLEKKLHSFNPDIVGITGYTCDVYSIIKILKNIKKYNNYILTVVGGHHATMMPEDFYKDSVDAIAIGEGEITFRELVDAYSERQDLRKIKGLALPDNGRLVFTEKRDTIDNLDLMPLADRKLTSRYRNHYFRGTWRPVASLMTSKGCPFRCNFCALWKVMGGKYKTRSAESVVNELRQIEEHYIDFAEDNALHDLQRAEKIYEIIKAEGIKKTYKLYGRSDTIVKRPDIIEKWKEIGMDLILIGLESYNDKGLENLNKKNSIKNNEEAIRILQANGVEIAAYFIVDPDYTREDFERLADYVVKLKLTQPIFTVLTPLPGTELYEQKHNELITHNYELFDFIHTVLPTRLPKQEFYQCLADLYRRTYSSAMTNKVKDEKGSMESEKITKQLFTLLSKAHSA
ncbi:MAG: radical SAM protein [Elusimicrobia bacterium]|nr:radical SAM protein [Elusimicrobiota bacterium]